MLVKKLLFFLMIPVFIVYSCGSDSSTEPEDSTDSAVNDILVDSLATKETVALYKNLRTLSLTKLLFGHQESTAYGVGWWGDFGRSDIHDVCGDYPAVYGWDVGEIHTSANIDGIDFGYMRTLIKQAYIRGGINTISMHIDNPATGGDAWDNTPAVASILPGGVNHSKYLALLDKIADYFLSLKTDDGKLIPIIYRPYHEHNHTWPWWGIASCTVQQYNELWRMTIKHFRDTRKVHNLIYAISPQDVYTSQEYLQRYPGDEYVDILGTDNYSLYSANDAVKLGKGLAEIAALAESKGKISALTEIGIENLTIPDWFTNYLLKAVKYNTSSLKTSWALVWRNASTSHHFAPYPGHSSVPDFLKFYQDPVTVFENDLPEMYK